MKIKNFSTILNKPKDSEFEESKHIFINQKGWGAINLTTRYGFFDLECLKEEKINLSLSIFLKKSKKEIYSVHQKIIHSKKTIKENPYIVNSLENVNVLFEDNAGEFELVSKIECNEISKEYNSYFTASKKIEDLNK